MFGYLFFRAHRFYKKKEKEDVPVTKSLVYVFLFQVMLIVGLETIINIFTDDFITYRNFDRNSLLAVQAIFLFALFLFDYLVYGREKRIEYLYKKYGDSNLNKIVKPWMLLLLLPATFALMLYLFSLTKGGLHFG